MLARQRNPLDKRPRRLCAKAEKTASELEQDATAMLTSAEREQLLGLLQKIFLPAGQNAPT